MKKSFGIYSIIWAICLAVFNVVVFVTPNIIGGVSKFGDSFWIGYIFITVAFIGQLICAFFALKATELKKLFYNLSLLSISYGGLFAMLVLGSVIMAIPAMPKWVGIIVCTIILALNAISVIKASAAATVVGTLDEKIKAETFFMKSLAIDAEGLVSSAKSELLRAEAKRVYEAIRYSDPMTNDMLSDANLQIKRQFAAFSDAVAAEDGELAKDTADAVLEALESRNQKCKLLK